jgi:uncharacterized tellurite resistance protein B-like protein
MSIWKYLGFDRPPAPEASTADTNAVRRIVSELDAMLPDRARLIATFAYILNRVARADLDVSDVEIARMERIVVTYGGLTQPQAVLVVEIARQQGNLFGGTEDYLVTRQFAEFATPEQRQQLLHCLFEVSAADDSISVEEEELIRQIATELGFGHADFVGVRAAYSTKRAVLKNLPGSS